MTAALDKLQPGAYSITVTWTLHGDDPNLAIAVVANHGGATTNGSQIAMKDIKGAVDHLSQKTYYDVYLNSWNSTNRVSDDKFTTTTAGASHNSVMKERIPADGSSDPQLQSLAAATLSNQKLFDLLVFEGTFIGHYTRRGASGGWTRVDRLVLPAGQQIPNSAISHIQSFTALEHLNALALTEPSNSLVTFEYNPGTGDHDPIPVHVDGGTPNGIPALVQTDQELFHLLVPLLDPKGIQRIAHLVHPNKTIQGPWKIAAMLPRLQEGNKVVSIALVQADGSGSLKAVVRVRPVDGADFLMSYQSDPHYNWRGPFDLFVENAPQHQKTISEVAGSPGMVQSIFGNQEQLDLIVPIADRQTGTITLSRFTQLANAEGGIRRNWTQQAPLPPLSGDPHTKVVSTSIMQDSNRNLQNIAHVITPNGQPLLAFYLFDPQKGSWSEPTPITKPDGKPIIVGEDNGLSDSKKGDQGGHHDKGHDGHHHSPHE